jgi:hypothetical protein
MTMALRLAAVFLSCAALAAACSGDSSAPAAQPTATSIAVVTETNATPTQPAASPPAATQQPTTPPTSVAGLPIIDMHFHPDASWDLSQLVALMDELGVQRAVGGSGDSGIEALRFAAAYPERFVPFAGQDGMRALNLAQGAPGWNLESEAALAYVDDLEALLAAGCWAGIGEAFVNTLGSHVSGGFSVPADSPFMRRIFDLSAQYGAPLSVHMDAAPVSVAELRHLLDSNPDGAFIWAHAGWYATPAQLRELLQSHPNLYIELSFRDEPRSFFPVSIGGVLQEDWRALLEEMPDRFVLGTDLLPPPTPQKYSELILFWRGVLDQLMPETARMLAHENAIRLLGAVTPPDERCLEMLDG